MPPAQYIVRESEGDDVVHADDMFKDTNPWDLLPPGWRRTYKEQTNRQPGLNSPFENLANYIGFFLNFFLTLITLTDAPCTN